MKLESADILPVVVEFKGLRPETHFEPGYYEVLELSTLHSNWKMARCGITQRSAGAEALPWECPLSPAQAQSVESMLGSGNVTVRLNLLPPNGASNAQPGCDRYRAEFYPLPPELTLPELGDAVHADEEE